MSLKISGEEKEANLSMLCGIESGTAKRLELSMKMLKTSFGETDSRLEMG